MRLFVCTVLSAANQEFYRGRMADLIASTGALLRPIPEHSAHLTYAFLQHPDEGVLESVVHAVAEAGGAHSAVPVRLAPPVVLFGRSEARLVLAQVLDGAAALADLSADITAAIRRFAPHADVADRHAPHVTLARFRRRTPRASAAAVVHALARGAAGASREDRVAAVQTMASELGPGGPRYAVRAQVRLVSQPVDPPPAGWYQDPDAR